MSEHSKRRPGVEPGRPTGTLDIGSVSDTIPEVAAEQSSVKVAVDSVIGDVGDTVYNAPIVDISVCDALRAPLPASEPSVSAEPVVRREEVLEPTRTMLHIESVRPRFEYEVLGLPGFFLQKVFNNEQYGEQPGTEPSKKREMHVQGTWVVIDASTHSSSPSFEGKRETRKNFDQMGVGHGTKKEVFFYVADIVNRDRSAQRAADVVSISVKAAFDKEMTPAQAMIAIDRSLKSVKKDESISAASAAMGSVGQDGWVELAGVGNIATLTFRHGEPLSAGTYSPMNGTTHSEGQKKSVSFGTEEYYEDADRNTPSHTLGNSLASSHKRRKFQGKEGDIIILASSGILECVSPFEIQQGVAKFSSDPQALQQYLWQIANERRHAEMYEMVIASRHTIDRKSLSKDSTLMVVKVGKPIVEHDVRPSAEIIAKVKKRLDQLVTTGDTIGSPSATIAWNSFSESTLKSIRTYLDRPVVKSETDQDRQQWNRTFFSLFCPATLMDRVADLSGGGHEQAARLYAFVQDIALVTYTYSLERDEPKIYQKLVDSASDQRQKFFLSKEEESLIDNNLGLGAPLLGTRQQNVVGPFQALLLRERLKMYRAHTSLAQGASVIQGVEDLNNFPQLQEAGVRISTNFRWLSRQKEPQQLLEIKKLTAVQLDTILFWAEEGELSLGISPISKKASEKLLASTLISLMLNKEIRSGTLRLPQRRNTNR